jgi:hypothetical protein
MSNTIPRRFFGRFIAVLAAILIVIGLPQSGLTVFAADPPINNDGIVSPAPALTTEWREILDMKFYINQIFDTRRNVKAAGRNDPIYAGEVYALDGFNYPVIDDGSGYMTSFEAAHPNGYYKIVRPNDFDDSAKEYELIFYSEEDEPVKTVSDRLVIGNLFNEGVFCNGRNRNIGYFLFKNEVYERRDLDGGDQAVQTSFDETSAVYHDYNHNSKSSAIVLITPEGFNQNLNPYFDAKTPLITGQPESIICQQGSPDDFLWVQAESTDSGSLTYQWYSNTSQSHTSGSAISGETGDVFTPPTTTTGIYYYYCEITNTNTSATRNITATVKSNAVKVDVRATRPTFPDSPDVGDPNESGDALGVIKAAEGSAELLPTIDSATLQDIFTANYSATPNENEQNVFNSAVDQPLIDAGDFIVITVVVEKKAEDAAPAEIKAQADYSAADEVFPLDISLLKSHFNGNRMLLADDKIDNAQTAELLKITIKLPAEMQGKLNYKLIRKHGSDIKTLTTAETDPSKERIEVSGDTLTIYAKKFSDYVLVADNPEVYVPPEDNSGSFGSAGNTAFTAVPEVVSPSAANAAETAETPQYTLADFIVGGKIIRRSDILNAGGSVNADRTLKNLEWVYKKCGSDTKSITIALRNAEYISYPTFDRIAAFGDKKNIDIYICADYRANNKTAARLIVNAKSYEKTDKTLNLKQEYLKAARFYAAIKNGTITIFVK